MMRVLQWLARHSPILMLVFCGLGFALPDIAAQLLPVLPYILFFLMFFTLLGINQRQLVRRLVAGHVWGFAVVHTIVMCVVFTGIAWVLGARDDLLLAIAAITATAPLFATGALVKSVGYDALQAMANTIAATLLMPLVLLVVLWLFRGDGASIDLALYVRRLLIYIVGPMLLATLARHYINEHILERIYPPVSQLTVVLVFAFPFGLTAAFRQTFNHDSGFASLLLAIAMCLSIGAFAAGYLLYRRGGDAEAFPAAIASGSRNVLLTYTIAGPFLGSIYLPLIGALQLPMYMMPLITRAMVKYRRKHKTS
ncbi:hypothetical protein KRX19_04615 [Cardiobacteriaceae bacterium TAE3-ERU3]|nr:hypothetical protein [Cardiobacteriaceae bacterium TAE3-ERU3]